VTNTKCANCPKSSTFVVVGENKEVSLLHATDEFASVLRGDPLPASWLTFRDEDQPYGWPEIDA